MSSGLLVVAALNSDNSIPSFNWIDIFEFTRVWTFSPVSSILMSLAVVSSLLLARSTFTVSTRSATSLDLTNPTKDTVTIPQNPRIWMTLEGDKTDPITPVATVNPRAMRIGLLVLTLNKLVQLLSEDSNEIHLSIFNRPVIPDRKSVV